MGIRLEVNGTPIEHFEHPGMDNGGMETSPSSQRKPYPRSQTTLSALDLDILNQQKNATSDNNVSVKYFNPCTVVTINLNFSSTNQQLSSTERIPRCMPWQTSLVDH